MSQAPLLPPALAETTTTRPVVVVGDVTVDVLCRPSGTIRHGDDVPASIRLVPGGAGANTATWLAAYGVPTSLVARVGADIAGRAAVTSLQDNGVRPVVSTDRSLPTGTVLVMVDEQGERSMLSDRGANAALQPEDLDLEGGIDGWPGRGHLHLSGYVLLDERSRETGLAALAMAHELGWTRSVDPQAVTLVEQAYAARFLAWITGVDLLLPNAAEVEALGGREAILAAGIGACVTSRGADGADWVAVRGDGSLVELHRPARRVEVTDTTGAGDAFNAGLLSRWLTGADASDCLDAGIQAGTSAVTRWGAR